MTNPRVLKVTTISGTFPLPLGLSLFRREPGDHIKAVDVSTVCLENGHLEWPTPGLLEPEHGYETAIFFRDCSLFHIFEQHYETREQALDGHESVVDKLLAGTLPLTIRLEVYFAHGVKQNDDGTQPEHTQPVA